MLSIFRVEEFIAPKTSDLSDWSEILFGAFFKALFIFSVILVKNKKVEISKSASNVLKFSHTVRKGFNAFASEIVINFDNFRVNYRTWKFSNLLTLTVFV